MKNRFSALKSGLMLVMVLVFTTTSDVFGADRYRLSTLVFNFGELIAKPVMDVDEDKTTGGFYSVPGESQYKIVVLLRHAAEDKVFISIQFSSGKINVQPNLLVNIDEETSVTIDKILMKLLVQRMSPQPAPDTSIVFQATQ